MPANDIWEKAVDLVGEDALLKLARHGLVLADRARIDRFLDGHRKSNDRLREAAAASMRAVGLTSARFELVITDGRPHIIATFPSGDEKEALLCAVQTLVDAWDPPDGWKRRDEDPAEREARIYDTNEVDVYAKGDDEEGLDR